MTYTQKHGINIGSWLCWGEQTLEERALWFLPKDIHRLRDMGFDHLRLCLRETYFWDESGQLNPRAVEILRQGIDWAHTAGMNTSVNLHHLRAHDFTDFKEPLIYSDPAEQAKFVQLWKDLQGVLADYSAERLALEFLNEPAARDNQRWNNLWRQAYAVLRALEPRRTLVLGSNRWNQIGALADLAVPADDPNMILDFHFYEPMLLTHYNSKIAWTRVPWKSNYPGRPLKAPAWLFGVYAGLKPKLNMAQRKDMWQQNQPFTRETIIKRFQQALTVAQKYKLPLNMGEFGLWRNSNTESGHGWLRDVLSVAAEFNISWTFWSYGKGVDNYGIINGEGNELPKAAILREFMR